jgi:hypothetical protein
LDQAVEAVGAVVLDGAGSMVRKVVVAVGQVIVAEDQYRSRQATAWLYVGDYWRKVCHRLAATE